MQNFQFFVFLSGWPILAEKLRSLTKTPDTKPPAHVRQARKYLESIAKNPKMAKVHVVNITTKYMKIRSK